MLPLLFAFYQLKLTSDLLVLVFVALLIQMPSAEVGIKGSIGTLVANGLGGLAAVVCYNLLVLAPSPVMVGLSVFIVALLFGQAYEAVRSAAQFEGTCVLAVLEVEVQVGAGRIAERGRPHERRFHNDR